MSAAARKRHGNMPQRRATLLTRGYQSSVAKQVTTTAPERPPIGTTRTTGPDLLGRRQLCGIEMGPGWTFLCKAKTSPSSTQQPTTPSALCETKPDIQRLVHNGKNYKANRNVKTTADILEKIRIPPEVQRILGHSCLATVRLERLRTNIDSGQSVSLAMVLPQVTLPCPPHSELLTQDAAAIPAKVLTPEKQVQQTLGGLLSMQTSSESREQTTQSEPRALDMVPIQIQDMTEPAHALERSASPSSPTGPAKPPEQKLEPDSESKPHSDLESETHCDRGLKSGFNSNSLKIQSDLEPEPKSELDLSMYLEPKSESDSEGTTSGHCAPVHESKLFPEQPGKKESPVGVESEDFCAVCLNGGDLLCCDDCPKVYHLSCHIPSLVSFPLGDWVCTLCRSDQAPEVKYGCESEHGSTDHHGVVTPYTLCSLDQRRCEKLTLLLSTHILSAPFQEPVSPLARHYYQIIKRPIDLSVIRKKLDHRNTLHYFTAEQFVDDIQLMFRNCATFNYPDSEVAHAGRNLEVFFRSKLREVFPDRTFPTKSHDRADRTSLTWLNRKRRDYHRKKGSHFLDRRSHHF